MAVSNFIKQNFVLVLGIALPVLLVLVFMLTTAEPAKNGPKPQYGMLFSNYTYDYSAAESAIPYSTDYVVKEGKLYARLTAQKDNYNTEQRVLYIYDPARESVEKIEPPRPADLGTDKQREILVPDFANATIDKASRSPDGYTLEVKDYRSRGVMDEIFGSRPGHYEMLVRHQDGGSYKVPPYAGVPYNSNVTFIGWIRLTPAAEAQTAP